MKKVIGWIPLIGFMFILIHSFITDEFTIKDYSLELLEFHAMYQAVSTVLIILITILYFLL